MEAPVHGGEILAVPSPPGPDPMVATLLKIAVHSGVIIINLLTLAKDIVY